MNRREFLRSLVAASVMVGVYVTGLEAVTNLGRTTSTSQTTPLQISSQSTTTQQQQQQQTSSTTTPAGYAYIAPLGAFAGLTYAYFTHPIYGQSIFVNVNSQWKAFSATCTHQPCTVNYQGSAINCPCHGGSFDPSSGAVVGGPPPSSLPEYGVKIQNGNVYVSLNTIN